MGFLDKRNSKRFEKMLNDNQDLVYSMINNSNLYYFNKGLIPNADALTSKPMLFTRTLQENAVWNQGMPEQIEWFYKDTYPKLTGFKADTKPALSYFWAKVTNKTVRVHSGIPSLISETMVNLIAGPGMSYTVNEVDGEETNPDTERLMTILEDNEFEDTLFPKGANMQSYGGYLGWKLNIDKEVSEFPILEFVQPENTEVIQKRGRNFAYIFKSTFEREDDTYELQEIYTKNKQGTPIITYKLFKYDGAELQEVEIDEKEYPTVEFVGLESIPAGIINNSALNPQFKGSPYGQSDYHNSTSLFNALDEILSQEMTALRFARPKRFMSKDMLHKNSSGLEETFDDFEVDYEMIDADPDDKNANSYIPIEQKIDVLMYSSAGSRYMERILNNAGLSPSTVGIVNIQNESTDADSQREREKTSLRTREMKLKIWRKELTRMFRIVLEFEDVMNGVTPQEYEVAINFNDFSIPGFEQRIKVGIEALNGGVVDQAGAVDMVWLDDLTDEEKEQMVANIKIENGVPQTIEETETLLEEAPVIEEPIEEEEIDENDTTT